MTDDLPPVVTLHPQATRSYLAALADLAGDLADTTAPAVREAVQTIRELISEVRVTREGDEVHAVVYGYLAALMAPTKQTVMVAWGRSRHGATVALARLAV